MYKKIKPLKNKSGIIIEKYADKIPPIVFLGTITAINAYTASDFYDKGLVDMAMNDPVLSNRYYANAIIGMEGLASNTIGVLYGIFTSHISQYHISKIKKFLK